MDLTSPRLAVRLAALAGLLAAALIACAPRAEAQVITNFEVFAVDRVAEGDIIHASTVWDAQGVSFLSHYLIFEEYGVNTPLSPTAIYNWSTFPYGVPMYTGTRPSAGAWVQLLPYGRYTFRSIHRYNGLIPGAGHAGRPGWGPKQLESPRQHVIVEAPPNCFHFDHAQTSTQGFTVSQYLDAQDLSPVGCGRPTLTRETGANFFTANQAYGGLASELGCENNLPPGRSIAVDFQSPSFLVHPTWRDSDFVQFHFSSNLEGLLQVIFQVIRPDGSSAQIAEARNGVPVYHPTSFTSVPISARMGHAVPPGSDVRGMKIRLLLPAVDLNYADGYVELDGICPYRRGIP